MRIGLVQFDIVNGCADQNLIKLDNMLLSGCDLYILPEMFHCGYTSDKSIMLHENETFVTDWMRSKSEELNADIFGGLAIKDSYGHCFNSFYCQLADGSIVTYDKRHLFIMGGENSVYSKGDKRIVVESHGIRCLLQICYDLRFPVWSRNRNDYDMAIYIANWPMSRRDAWMSLLKARAIENQCYVVGVNRVGSADGLTYSGDSVIFGPRGDVIALASSGKECIVDGEIDIEQLRKFRSKFNVLADSDDFIISK